MSTNVTLIAVEPDVIARLLGLQEHPAESFDNVLRRVFVNHQRAPGASSAGNGPAASGAERGSIRYTLLGQEHVAGDAATAMVEILADLSRHCPGLPDRLAAKTRGRTRNRLARTPAACYPGRPDLAQHARMVVPGWYVDCNIDNRRKDEILRAACALAGLVYGRDLIIRLDNA
jgi:hypothetical protein